MAHVRSGIEFERRVYDVDGENAVRCVVFDEWHGCGCGAALALLLVFDVRAELRAEAPDPVSQERGARLAEVVLASLRDPALLDGVDWALMPIHRTSSSGRRSSTHGHVGSHAYAGGSAGGERRRSARKMSISGAIHGLVSASQPSRR